MQAGTAEVGKLAAGVAEIGNVKNSGTFAVQSTLQTGANAIGKLAANSGIDIGDVDILSIAAGDNNIGNVDIASSVALDVSAATVTVDLGANNDVTATGSIAHDAVDSGNPLKIGAKVETSLKGITAAADADRTDLYADSDGVLVVKLNTTGADVINERVSNTNGTSTAFSNFSAVASTFNYITDIIVWNSSATDGYVDIRDGTAGTILATIPAPQTGGATHRFATPLKSTANTAMAYDVSGAISTVYITASGFQSKV